MPSGIYKKTKEHNRKVSETLKRKGIKPKKPFRWTDKKRPPFSKECIEKMRKSRKGTKLSVETRKKMSEAHKGEKAYNYKGNLSANKVRIRHQIEFRLWREAVFARDNWTCQKCKERGNKLHPHHILNFAQYVDLRFAIDNGITFCIKCHMKFHNKYGRENNTKRQLKEFVEGKTKKISRISAKELGLI